MVLEMATARAAVLLGIVVVGLVVGSTNVTAGRVRDAAMAAGSVAVSVCTGGSRFGVRMDASPLGHTVRRFETVGVDRHAEVAASATTAARRCEVLSDGNK